MKKTIFLLLAILATLAIHAQEKQIPQTETTLDDLKAMLEMDGYETFSFDLTSLLDGQYTISVIAKEFADGKEINEEEIFVTENKTMISEFPEESQKRIIEKGTADDPEHGVYRQTDRLQIAFFPINQKEKTRNSLISFNKKGKFRRTFILKTVKGSDAEICRYYIRPFKTEKLTESEFHPLLLLGSVWFDSHYNIFRFCGENEIAPDLSSDILKDTPHYFVIGIKVQQNK